MTNSVSSNRPEKYNIATFFSGNVLGFEQTNEFIVVYANDFDKSTCQTY
ncbi:cytosine-specific methyltransferase [Streptococcus pneumoniae]|nr:cytosine-specific methyltransferase [Streptococcus pneumoniae]VJS23057.1 cytosine-specific methyltransferase [Streptococcus pneumoniae]VKM46771.1 cytosine-specific methyltransferase [Streptococcus pneumoniae]VKN69370.1 cytosine-specific methyltransferase [Streptococcus pneumoniae]VLK00141.1 cytosine-specific methyltransferase [Streptococcus pneumoniae]